MYAILVGVTGLLSLLRLVGMAVGSIRAANVLHNAMACSLLLTTCRFFDVNPVGRIMNRYAHSTLPPPAAGGWWQLSGSCIPLSRVYGYFFTAHTDNPTDGAAALYDPLREQ